MDKYILTGSNEKQGTLQDIKPSQQIDFLQREDKEIWLRKLNENSQQTIRTREWKSCHNARIRRLKQRVEIVACLYGTNSSETRSSVYCQIFSRRDNYHETSWSECATRWQFTESGKVFIGELDVSNFLNGRRENRVTMARKFARNRGASAASFILQRGIKSEQRRQLPPVFLWRS